MFSSLEIGMNRMAFQEYGEGTITGWYTLYMHCKDQYKEQIWYFFRGPIINRTGFTENLHFYIYLERIGSIYLERR